MKSARNIKHLLGLKRTTEYTCIKCTHKAQKLGMVLKSGKEILSPNIRYMFMISTIKYPTPMDRSLAATL